jgi:hypothetical protein
MRSVTSLASLAAGLFCAAGVAEPARVGIQGHDGPVSRGAPGESTGAHSLDAIISQGKIEKNANSVLGNSSGYGDGFENAPSGASQFPRALDHYKTRPPWRVAGIDYHVGIPDGVALKDPTVERLPVGVSYDSGAHTITIGSSNVTLDGWDFSKENGVQLLIKANNATIRNCLFKVGSNMGVLGVAVIADSSAGDIAFLNDEFDGSDIPVTVQLGTMLQIANVGTVSFKYNFFHDSGGDMIDFTGGPQVDIIQYNLFYRIGVNTGHADAHQWYNSQVTRGDIGFNTHYHDSKNRLGGNGTDAVLSEGPVATMSNVVVHNETVLETVPGNSNWTLGFYAALGGVADHVSFHDIYIDPTGSMNFTGMWMEAAGKYGANLAHPFAMANIVNMVNGVAYTSYPRNASWRVVPDGSGYTPFFNDVYAVTAYPSSGVLHVGDTVEIVLEMDARYSVAGAPRLLLNTGNFATFSTGSKTSELVFSYKVEASDRARPSLAVTGFSANGAIIADQVGNTASFNGLDQIFGRLTVRAAAPSLPRGAERLAAAIDHIMLAIEHGRQGHAADFQRHAKTALCNAEAAQKEESVSDIKRAIIYLGVAMYHSERADLVLAVRQGGKALTYLKMAAAGQTKPAAAGDAQTATTKIRSSCPFGNSYDDGCSAALATGTKIPNFFSGYVGRTYPVRPPWNVAGVDFPVGLPADMPLLDPSIAPLPNGCTYSQSADPIVRCKGDDITISGYDFSLHNGIQLIISGVNNIVSKNNFKMGQKCKDPIVNYFTDAPGSFTFTYNSVEGGGRACRELLFGTMLNGTYGDGSSSIVEYNLFSNTPSDVMDAGGPKGSGQASYVLKYNLYLVEGFQGHPDTTQFNGGNFDSIVIEFNTFYNLPPASTQVFHVEAQLTSEIKNAVVAYNSIATIGNCNSANNCSTNYDVACKQDLGANRNINFSAYGNYIDWSGGYGALANYACQNAIWGTPLPNIDLSTGTPLAAP